MRAGCSTQHRTRGGRSCLQLSWVIRWMWAALGWNNRLGIRINWVAVSKSGIPDSTVLEWELFCRMSINHSEVVVKLVGGNVYVYVLPSSCRPWPRVKWGCLWSLSGLGTLFAPMCSLLDVAVYSRPPYMTRAASFMRATPGCSLCSSLRICSSKEGGATVRRPHIWKEGGKMVHE